MKSRTKQPEPLVEVVRSQLEEIKKYKWIESEKAGRDIGLARATREWMALHFPAWKCHGWERAVQEALQSQNGRN